MARNKKLTKAARERMARTGENYTTARTALLSADDPTETHRVLAVDDPEPGTGAVAAVWRTLRVSYVIRRDGQVVDDSGPTARSYALSPHHVSWMQALVGQRVGGVRRLEVEFARRGWGRCTIEARLLAVDPYVPPPPSELVRGQGRPVGPGDRVRVRFLLTLAPSHAPVGKTGPMGLWVTVGAGELEPDVERVVIGMCAGGSRAASLPPRDALPERWIWLDLLEVGWPIRTR